MIREIFLKVKPDSLNHFLGIDMDISNALSDFCNITLRVFLEDFGLEIHELRYAG
jgi:hypothetical protein